MSSNLAIVSAASAALLGLLVACSSSDAGTSGGTKNATDGGTDTTTPGTNDPTPVPTTPQSLEAQYATAECAYLARCYPPRFAEDFGDQNGCVTAKSSLFATAFHADSTAGLATQITACAAAEAARACDGDRLTIPVACRFQGTRENGTACTYDAQCKSGSCFGTDATACGTCTALAAEGADCTAAECVSGSQCDGTRTCAPIPKIGAPCEGAANAAECSVGAVCIDEVCVKLGGAGEDCAAGNGCDDGLTCHDASKCAEDTRAAIGAACKMADNGITIGCNGGFCASPSTGNPGKCTAWGKEGGDCNEDADPAILCGEGLSCISGKCHSPSSARPTTCK